MTDTLPMLIQWYLFGVFAIALVLIGLHLTTRTKMDELQTAAIILASIRWPLMILSLAVGALICAARLIESRL